MFIISNLDGFTPVSVTPKRRANSPANDMKEETLPLLSAFILSSYTLLSHTWRDRRSSALSPLSCPERKRYVTANNQK